MEMNEVIEHLEETYNSIIWDIVDGSCDESDREKYISLAVAINILKRYQSGKISGYLNFLNTYASAEFVKDDFGRGVLVLHFPENANLKNWFHAVELRQDLPSCFRSVPIKDFLEQKEKEYADFVKENNE